MDSLHRQRRDAARAHLVAQRHQAGLFTGPPAMLKFVSDWMNSVYAGHVLAYTEGVILQAVGEKKALKTNWGEIDTFQWESRRIAEGLKPGKSARVKIGIPGNQTMIGIRRVTEKEAERWPHYEAGKPVYQVGNGDRRINWDEDPPQSLEGALTNLDVRLETMKRRVMLRIDSLERRGGGLGPHGEAGLVESHLLAAECRKYTTKAKVYKTKASKVFPLDLTGWKYLDDDGASLIDKVNAEIAVDNAKWKPVIEQAEAELRGAAKLYEDLNSGATPYPTAIPDWKKLRDQYGLPEEGDGAWDVNSILDAYDKKRVPDERWVWSPDENTRVVMENARKMIREPIKANELNRALADRGWTQISCILWFKQHTNRGGQWYFEERELQVDARNTYPRNVVSFLFGLNEIDRVCRHEMQHLGQYLLGLLKGLKDPAGLPSKDIRTPGTTPSGRKIRPNNRGLGPKVKHELRDIEFETDLADASASFERQVLKVPVAKRRAFLEAFVDAPGENRLLSGTPPNQHFKVWHRMDKGKWKEAVKQLAKVIQDRGIEMPAGERPLPRAASRNAGLLKPPPQLLEAVTEWVVGRAAAVSLAAVEEEIREIRAGNRQEKLAERLASFEMLAHTLRDKAVGKVDAPIFRTDRRAFKADVAGWDYLRGHRWNSRKDPEWKRGISVRISWPKADGRTWGGSWKPGDHVLMIYPPELGNFGTSHTDEWRVWERHIHRVVRHEMQHVTQELLSHIKGFPGAAGLAPGVHAPVFDSTYGTREHALEEAEYQTDLTDAIDRIERELQRIDPEQRHLHLKALLDAKDRTFAVWKKRAPDKWRDAVQKAVAELHDRGAFPSSRAFREQTPEDALRDLGVSASSRVASRYLTGSMLNDTSRLPSIGARAVTVDIDTDNALAEIAFDDGGSLMAHLSMTPTSPQDSDTAAWQQSKLDRKAQNWRAFREAAALKRGEPVELVPSSRAVANMRLGTWTETRGRCPYCPPDVYC